MKKTFGMVALLLATIVMTGCESGGGNSAGFEVTTFSFQEEENGEWGIMDFNGKVIVKPKFAGCPTSVINGMFSVYDEEDMLYTLYSLDDESPKKIGSYKDIGAFTGKYCPVLDKNDNLKYIDKEGNSVFDIKKMKGHKVMAAFNFFSGLAMMRLDNNKWGYINEDCEIVVPFKYADAWNFSNGMAIVYLNDPDETNAKWGVIDTEGNMLFTKKFSEMIPNNFKFEDGMIEVTDPEYETFMFLDKEGKTVKKVKKDISPSSLYNGMYVTYNKESELMGLSTVDGSTVLKEKYETVLYNGKLIAAKADNGKWYFMSDKGEKRCRLPKGGLVTLLEPEYKNSDKVVIAGDYGDYILVNNEGKEIETDVEIFYYGTAYYWGVTLPEEETYEEDYDYEANNEYSDSIEVE